MKQRAPSGLSRFINAPGGITVADAEMRAELRLLSIRDKAIAQMDALIAALGSAIALSANTRGAASQQIATIAADLIAVGGTFGASGVSAAAYVVCELLDRFETAQTWDASALSVCHNAMQLFRTGCSLQDQERVLDAVHRLVHRFDGVSA